LISDTVLVGGFDRKLYAVDSSTGTQKWSFEATHWVWTRPVIDGGLAYFGDFDGNVYGVNVSSGTASWQLNLAKGAIRGAPVLTRNVLVVGTEDGWLVGIDPSSHTTRWETKVAAVLAADLVAAEDGSVLLAPSGCVTLPSSGEKVYYTSLDPLTGELRRAQGPVC
jgi:outer membrane protein assembly factor BamB